MVPSLRELRRLIGIEDHDPDCRLVLKGAFPDVAGVHERVGDFHRERVRIAGLIIQQLLGEEQSFSV